MSRKTTTKASCLIPVYLAENDDNHSGYTNALLKIVDIFGYLFLRLLRKFHQILLILVFHAYAQANQPGQNENADDTLSTDPFSLLAYINKANHQRSFRALLTYEANGYINTMRLIQTVADDKINQRLIFLDGPKRQVLRQKVLSNCEDSIPTWQLWPRDLEVGKLSLVYDIRSGGLERVADREAHIVDVMPRDTHRYGYRFSIDSETGLLLKTLFIVNKHVIERLQFVELSLYEDKVKATNDSLADTSAAENDGQSLMISAEKSCQSTESHNDWHVDWLPEGFVSAGNRLTDHGEQVLVFSDGLATLSVFIVEQYKSMPKATARYGATVAVITPMKINDKFMVIAVGEIPVATARQVAISVRPNSDAQ